MLINPYVFGGPWTPSRITTSLWLDASDSSTITTVSGAVSQWNDKSGNGYNALQSTAGSRPIYSAQALNGLPGLVFTGSTFLQSSLGNYSLITRSFYAVYSVTTTNNQGIFILLPAGASANDFNSLDGVAYTSAASNTGGFRVIGSSSNSYDLSNTTSGAAIFAEVKGPGSGSIYRFDGSPTTDSAFTEFSSVSGRSGYVIGRRWLNGALGGPFMNGTLQELVYCPDTHSTDIRNRMFGYLAWKWGLSASLPAGHPYKNAAPTV